MDVEYSFMKASAKALWKDIRRETKARRQFEKTLVGAVSNMLAIGSTPISCPKPGTRWTDPVTEKHYRVWWDYDAAEDRVIATNLKEEG